MLTVSFKSVLEGVFKRAGESLEQVGDEDKLAVIECIADRFKTAFEYYKWPVYTHTEQRWFAPAWDAGETYAEGDEVYFADADSYYAANQAASAGQSPTTHPAKWDELEDFRHLVAYEQEGAAAIAAFVDAWDRDPLADPAAQPLRYSLRNDGAYFAPDLEDTSVWVEYRPRCPNFAAELFDAAEDYEAGRVLYYEPTGQVYEVVTAASAGQTPETHADKFELTEFPDFLARAVKVGAYADWLDGDDQHSKGARKEQSFDELLDDQVWQITKLQGQTGRLRKASA